MNHTRNTSILQRLPQILAVTAASYGLALHSRGERLRAATGSKTGRKGAAEREHKNQPGR